MPKQYERRRQTVPKRICVRSSGPAQGIRPEPRLQIPPLGRSPARHYQELNDESCLAVRPGTRKSRAAANVWSTQVSIGANLGSLSVSAGNRADAVVNYTCMARSGPAKPTMPPINESAATAVLQANQAFYDAFEASDLDAMSEVWAREQTTACTHPGWGTLHGWAEISASWFAMFQQSPPLQFILTAAKVNIAGEIAWVTVDENLIGVAGRAGDTVAALNIFECSTGRWRMLCHHGSGVATGPRPF